MSGASWASIQKMEQARWHRFAGDHAHENEQCRIAASMPEINQVIAAQLARLAAENGWAIPSVGRAAAKRRRKARTT